MCVFPTRYRLFVGRARRRVAVLTIATPPVQSATPRAANVSDPAVSQRTRLNSACGQRRREQPVEARPLTSSTIAQALRRIRASSSGGEWPRVDASRVAKDPLEKVVAVIPSQPVDRGSGVRRGVPTCSISCCRPAYRRVADRRFADPERILKATSRGRRISNPSKNTIFPWWALPGSNR